jgi:hypothetical protein
MSRVGHEDYLTAIVIFAWLEIPPIRKLGEKWSEGQRGDAVPQGRFPSSRRMRLFPNGSGTILLKRGTTATIGETHFPKKYFANDVTQEGYRGLNGGYRRCDGDAWLGDGTGRGHDEAAVEKRAIESATKHYGTLLRAVTRVGATDDAATVERRTAAADSSRNPGQRGRLLGRCGWVGVLMELL